MATTGGNVQDSLLVEAPLKNSQKMGGWFLDADVRHLCLGKGYDYLREPVKKSIIIDLWI